MCCGQIVWRTNLCSVENQKNYVVWSDTSEFYRCGVGRPTLMSVDMVDKDDEIFGITTVIRKRETYIVR